jgi:hypothetical protein
VEQGAPSPQPKVMVKVRRRSGSAVTSMAVIVVPVKVNRMTSESLPQRLLAPGLPRSEQIETDTADHGRQPGRQVLHL